MNSLRFERAVLSKFQRSQGPYPRTFRQQHPEAFETSEPSRAGHALRLDADGARSGIGSFPVFEFSLEVRRLIHAADAIESPNREQIKSAKVRDSFPGETADGSFCSLQRRARRNNGSGRLRTRAALGEPAVRLDDRLIAFADQPFPPDSPAKLFELSRSAFV